MHRTSLFFFSAGAVLVASLLFPSPLPASLLIQEGFDYGSTSQNLGGISGTATGLTGAYSSAIVDGGTMEYVPTSLNFGQLSVSGGHAALLRSGSESFFISSRQLATGSVTGTVYGSFLFQQESPESNEDVNGLLFGQENTTDSFATVSFLTDTYNNEVQGIRADPGNDGSYPSSYEGFATGQGINAPGTAVTLALFEMTNVGALTGTQTVTLWMLNLAQFTNLKADGLTTAELNAAAIGTGGANVMERNALSLDGSGGYITLGDSDYLSLFSFRSSYRMDEIRLSNSSLDEVTPIPEPGAALVIALASLFPVLGRGRRRR
jgi:hypothetical protein